MQLSIIIPIYNEEKNINELLRQLIPVLKNLTPRYEVIFVNDGSTDGSLSLLLKARKKNRAIKIISFSRNFGHMPAVEAGLFYAKGKKVVLMDADLQDPPQLIPQLYKQSKKFDVVFAVKKLRQEGRLMNFLFSSYYRILNSVAQHRMPLNAGTFSIMDYKVVTILRQLPERNKYFSGLRAWTGFAQTGIEYKRPKRVEGKPASMNRLLKLAIDGLVSFSYIPLRIASFLGFAIAAISFIFIIVVLIARFIFGFGLIGWASTMSSILLMGGIQLITLGIIGEYLGRIYEEVKNRPNYIISKTHGFSSSRLKQK